MAEVRFTAAEFEKTFELPCGESNQLILVKHKAGVLEMEDAHFHLNSAVMMPDYGPCEPDSEPEDRITGLAVLHVALKHAQDNPTKKLMALGHTDTSGQDAYNLTLSRLRSQNVVALLTNDKDTWVGVSQSKHKVEDYQQILKWANVTYGWDCDPGPVDNIRGSGTVQATRNFQRSYNTDYGQAIGVDGIVGPQTWGAFFDVYQTELMALLETDAEGMAEYYLADVLGDGCGEAHPIDEPSKDSYRSETNRRVELLFFEEAELPALLCHTGDECEPSKCPVYGEGSGYTFEYLPCEKLPQTAAKVEITGGDDHFAPGPEQLEVQLKIENPGKRSGKVLVFATGIDEPVYVKTHGQDDLLDESTTSFSWDGVCTAEEGPLQGPRMVNPLYSPYTLRVVVGGAKAEHTFKVHYAGLQLHEGPWVSEDEEPEKADKPRWVQWRLNQLGYYAGPVDGAIGGNTKRSIRRYKAYHPDLYPDKTANITSKLLEKLEAGDNDKSPHPVFESGHEEDWLDPALTAKVFVACDQYYYEYNDLLSPRKKVEHEKKNLVRPSLALRAEVLILSKDENPGDEGAGVSAPQAVGPVRVRWTFEDEAEDTSILPDGTTATVPSRTKQYMDLALAVVPKPTDQSTAADNTPKKYAGLRSGDGKHDNRVAFWGATGDLGYRVETDATLRAYLTRAHADPTTRQDLLGCAMIICRPSYMAGDSYRFKATLDFARETNKDQLEADYSTPPEATTGKLIVWRRFQVGRWITWAQRNEAGQATDAAGNAITVPNGEVLTWATVQSHFAEAYHHMPIPAGQPRTAFMSLAEYNTIVQARCTNAAYRTAVQADATAATSGNPTSLNVTNYCVDFQTARLPGETDWNYGLRIGSTAASIWSDINDDVVALLERKLRPVAPMGLLVLDYKAICPTQFRNNTIYTTLDVPAGRSAWADKRGVTMIEVDLSMDQDTLMAHEIGHNFYLSHWEVPTGDTYRRPIDHDQNDHNCMMSYAWNLTNRTDNVNNNGWLFLGRFCGKCNLKLRGWNIGQSGLPTQS